jgi:protein-tyrosine phosphatase
MKRIIATISLPLLALLPMQVLAGTITSPVAERTAPDKVVLRWTDSDPVDVFVAEAPETPIAQAKLVSAKDADGTYEASVAETPRPYFILRDKRGKQTVRVAERLIPLEQGSNFRDVGGYPAAGGKHVKWGLIYRSGGQPVLTDADVKEVQALGIANLVDLRSNEERAFAPTRLDGIPYQAVGYSMAKLAPAGGSIKNGESIYRNFPTMLAPQLRLIFADLLAKKGAVAYNCSAGQDRTGFATAMVLSALGVPRDVIIADYHLSTTYRRPEWEMRKISETEAAGSPTLAMFAKMQQNPAAAKPQPLKDPDGTAFLSYAFDEVEKRWGSVDGYLEKEVGVTKVDIAALRATYLE